MDVTIKLEMESDSEGDVYPKMSLEHECKALKTEPAEAHIWEVPVVNMKCEYEASPKNADEQGRISLAQEHQVKPEPVEQDIEGSTLCMVSDQKAGAKKWKRAADNSNNKKREARGAPPQTGNARQQCDAGHRAEAKKTKRSVKAAGLQKVHQSLKDATSEPGDKHHQCAVCHKCFFSYYNLQTHIRLHTGEKPYACNICHRRFNQNVRLRRHLITHTGEKPFECDICHRRFTEKATLKGHSRIHTGEKPFECKICQRRFTERPTLQRHLLTHTAEKPFECDVCQRRFARKYYLKTHFLTHTGEKPHKCKICQRGFAKKFNLRTHTLTHKTK